MIVIFDNNILISAALFWTSVPAEAFRKARKNDNKILASNPVLEELKTTLLDSKFDKYVSLPKRIEFYEMYKSSVQTVPITTSIVACRDPKDDMFLELAVSGNANIIITGDKDLLKLNPFRGIQVVTPKEFVQKI